MQNTHTQIPGYSSIVHITKCTHLCNHYPGPEIEYYPNVKAPSCPLTISMLPFSLNVSSVLTSVTID